MKLFYIANARMPNEKAHGIQLAKMCEAFIGAGVDLELILPNKSNSNKSIEEFYEFGHPIKVRRLPAFNFASNTSFGFNLNAFTFAISYFFYLLKKKLSGTKGIIYTIDLDQFSFFLIPFLGMPYFFETHATKRKNFIYKFFLRSVNGVIAINNFIKEDLIHKFSLNKNKVLVCPNGIDLRMFHETPKFEAKRILDIESDKHVIVYIGRIYDWKGMDILIPTAKLLGEKFIFYIVGATEAEFKNSAKIDKLPDNIFCVGARPYKEMPVWESAADILLLLGTKQNAYSYFQTSPMKLFEYMAIGREIVASRTPALEDIVSDKEVIFYEPDNSKDLADKIFYTSNNLSKIESRVFKAKEKVANLTWSRRAEKVNKFILQNI